MLDFELLYVTIGGKERISTATMPAIFLVSKSREGILVLLLVSERAEAESACALHTTHTQDTK